MDNSRDDAGHGTDATGFDDAAAQGSRKPRIAVLRAEPTAGPPARAAGPARYPRFEDGDGAGQGAAYTAADSTRPRRGHKGRWLLLLAAVLLLILVAAISSVAFSPGGDHTISEPKTTRGSTSTETSREATTGPAVDDATEAPAPTAAGPVDVPDEASAGSTPAPAPVAVPRSEEARPTERFRTERPVSEPAPRTVPAAPQAREVAPAEPEPAEDENAPPVDQEGAVQTAREFYAALSMGDGAAAAQYVIPSKRRSGPLSGSELTRYYSSLRRPMRLQRATPIADDAVRVTYEYVLMDGRLCQGQATVFVVQGFDRPLIRSIRAQGPC